MSTRKLVTADVLFGLQLVIGCMLVGSRLFRMAETTQGVLLSEFVLFGSFAALNLSLAIAANRVGSTRNTKQLIFVHTFWVISCVACFCATLAHGGYVWDKSDTLAITVSVLAGCAILGFGRLCYGLMVTDSILRGCVAMALKGWPQLMLAYKMSEYGSSGLPGLAVWCGHTTILLRISQVCFALRKRYWKDRNLWGLLIGDVGNELTWLVATAVWLTH
jgi:hypothetical protein